MANLVELSNQLEYVPQEQLVQMSQDPNSMYPSFLVLSEIQRRTQMKKMYEAQQPKPQTTVAEEVVQEFAGQQGLQGAMAQSPGPQNAFQPGDMGNMAPPSPMQAMASGGKTDYVTGGLVDNFLSGDYGILGMLNNNPELMFGAAGLAAKNNFRGSLLGELYNQYKERKDNKETEEVEETVEAMASGGRTGYQAGGDTALAETFNNPMTKTKFQSAGEMILDAGSDVVQWAKNNPVDAAIIGVSLVPGVGWLAGAGLRTISAARKAMKGKNIVKSMYSKSKPIDVKTTTTPKILGNKGLSAADDLGYGSGSSAFGKITPDRVFDPKRYYGTLGTTYGIKQLYDYGMSPAEIQENETDPTTIQTQNEDSKDKVNKDVITGDVNVNKGLRERFKDFATSPNNADMLVALGGAIGSAKNLGELSSGISKAYFDVKSSRDAKDLAGLQGRLIEAQAAKYEADISNMDVNQIIAEMNAINKGVESGAITIDDELQAYVSSLRARLQALREKTGTGFAASETPTGGDILARNRVA